MYNIIFTETWLTSNIETLDLGLDKGLFNAAIEATTQVSYQKVVAFY